jgi:hypothetical protein
MTRLQYGRGDIAAWAEFSGDFNPVHFDPNVAARLGLADVPVHGMRVMLDVKSALYRTAGENPVAAHESLMFKATLRAAVLRDRPYQLHIDPGANRLKFSVVEEISGKTCINGYLRAASSKEAAVGGAATRGVAAASPHTPGKEVLERQIAQFIALAGQATPAWMLLDALLFRHLLLHESALFGDVARVFGIDGVHSAHALMRDVAVLQTHHETLIPPRMKSLTLDGLLKAMSDGGVCFEIEAPVMTGDASSGLAITGSLVARTGVALSTRTSIGLLALPPFFPTATGA